MTDRQALIEKIRILPDQIAALVGGLTEEQLTTPYLCGEWTVAQNVHHLVDSHVNSYIRFKLILTEDYPTLGDYDQDAWATLPDASSAQVEYSLIILRGLHERWVKLLQSLDASQWSRAGVHPANGEVTIDSLLVTYAGHGEAHIDQIQRTLGAQTA